MERTSFRKSQKRSRLAVGLSLAALSLAIWGAHAALHSSLYLVRTVDIVNHPASAPVSAATVNELANVPLGKENLYTLDLARVEKRILANSWIKDVKLQKRFPQTLEVSVSFRKPRAVLQEGNSNLVYIDHEGVSFGPVDLAEEADLPMFSGFTGTQTAELTEGIKLLDRWEAGKSGRYSQLSGLSWDSSRGYRLLVTYPLKESRSPARAMIHLGVAPPTDDLTWRVLDSNLGKVFKYLQSRSILAHQIFVGDGKKIVVKTAHGS